MLCLPVMEWQDEKIKVKFATYLKTYFLNKEAVKVIEQVNHWKN